MSMCRMYCVTNRALAGEGFLEQIERTAKSGVDGIILREKDLSEAEYEELALKVQKICRAAGVPLILHTYVNVARRLGIRSIHLPLGKALALGETEKKDFDVLGVSTHSVEEAEAAWKAGAGYVTAGHVFATDCKKGLPPRGLDFLRAVCKTVPIPVYAIGGITPENASACVEVGAAGVCLMSYFMKK